MYQYEPEGHFFVKLHSPRPPPKTGFLSAALFMYYFMMLCYLLWANHITEQLNGTRGL